MPTPDPAIPPELLLPAPRRIRPRPWWDRPVPSLGVWYRLNQFVSPLIVLVLLAVTLGCVVECRSPERRFEGDNVCVLDHPRDPRRSVIYPCSGYRCVAADGS